MAVLAGMQWSSSGPLIGPGTDPEDNITGYKDPTVVYHNGKWHVFATASGPSGLNLVYLSFSMWAQAASATPRYLEVTAIGSGYRA